VILGQSPHRVEVIIVESPHVRPAASAAYPGPGVLAVAPLSEMTTDAEPLLPAGSACRRGARSTR